MNTNDIANQISEIERLKNALGYPLVPMRTLAAMVMDSGIFKPRPISEWHQDMGDVLWWCWVTKDSRLLRERPEKPYTPHWLGEAPYVGSPLDCGITVEAHVRLISQLDQDHKPEIVRRSLGGWPGYHTHFTLIPIPQEPK